MQKAGALEGEQGAKSDLQEELDFYQARCKKLESWLKELRPGSERLSLAAARAYTAAAAVLTPRNMRSGPLCHRVLQEAQRRHGQAAAG